MRRPEVGQQCAQVVDAVLRLGGTTSPDDTPDASSITLTWLRTAPGTIWLALLTGTTPSLQHAPAMDDALLAVAQSMRLP